MLGIDDPADAKAGALRTRLAKKLGKLEKRGKRILPFDSGAEMHAKLRARVDPADQLVLGARPLPAV